MKAGISAGTTFDSIPENYVCPVCDAPKADFKETLLSAAI